jgi:hypothetical protein
MFGRRDVAGELVTANFREFFFFSTYFVNKGKRGRARTRGHRGYIVALE